MKSPNAIFMTAHAWLITAGFLDGYRMLGALVMGGLLFWAASRAK